MEDDDISKKKGMERLGSFGLLTYAEFLPLSHHIDAVVIGVVCSVKEGESEG